MDVKFIFKEQVSEELLFLLSNFKNNNLRHFSNATFIPMGFKFNKVYYYQENDTMISFKILCCCFHSKSENWYFLVQFPNGETKWINEFLDDKYFFESVDEYFDYLNGNNRLALEIKLTRLYVINGTENEYNKHFVNQHTWVWNDGLSKPCTKETLISYIIYNENGIFLVMDKVKDEFFTKEECLKSRLNNMKIVEFNDNPSISISISIEKRSEPIIRTLQFIEK